MMHEHDGAITVVSGLARCGSSMVMRMLRAGGMELYCDHETSFETDKMLGLPDDHEWLGQCVGKAVKLLDPQVFTPPVSRAYRVIWLSRDAVEQAKSQVKFLTMLGVVSTELSKDPETARRISESLRLDEVIALAIWGDRRARMLMLSFEGLLADPMYTAGLIADFVSLSRESVLGMARIVVSRGPECYPGLLELKEMKGDSGDESRAQGGLLVNAAEGGGA